MVVDLVYRVHNLSSKGETEPIQRFYNWINTAAAFESSEFVVDNEKFYWKIISSTDFKDIIDEDTIDWFLIYSDNKDFMAIGKMRFDELNLIGEKRELYISTLWVLKSNIESLKVGEMPISLWSPYQEKTPYERLNYYLTQLMLKLKDHRVALTEFVDYKISKSGRRRIR